MPERPVTQPAVGDRGASPAASATRFPSTPRLRCPDCDGASGRALGRFVYYRTGMELLPCTSCGLWWVNALLDRSVLEPHFEKAYKEEEGYYTRRRRMIFRDLARQVSQVTPLGGRVLDVGGAMGHFLASLERRRPDLSSMLTDCSRIAVEAAQRRGFQAAQLDAGELARLGGEFDTVVLSDVLYYVPDLPRVWQALPSLLAPGGAVVIRYPNKYWLIRLLGPRRRIGIPYFNVEHLYVLTPRYLTRRLRAMGFRVRHAPSPALRGEHGPWLGVAERVIGAIAWLTRGRVILSPSRLLVATRVRS